MTYSLVIRTYTDNKIKKKDVRHERTTTLPGNKLLEALNISLLV